MWRKFTVVVFEGSLLRSCRSTESLLLSSCHLCASVSNAAAALGSVAAAAGVAPVVVRTQMLNVYMLIFVDALGAGSVMK
jgi:hypothetical protein